MQIGPVTLPYHPLVLAPMEEVTDPSFRLLCKRHGADWLYSEFVNADGLIRGAGTQKLLFDSSEKPFSIQIYGQNAEALIESAKIVEDAAQPDIIDLNAGCPVKKIANRGAGAGLLREPEKLVSIAEQLVKAVKTPITVKTRLGWDSESIIAYELAERLQDVGICAITIHARTRAQAYCGEANWNEIARIKQNPRLTIPLIGNGDIDSPQKAQEAFSRYGVDGIMIGRATFGRPWIFKEIKHYLTTGEAPQPPTLDEKVRIALEHLDLSIEHKGLPRGIFQFRRHLNHYFRAIPHFREYRIRLLTETDPEQLRNLIQNIPTTCNPLHPNPFHSSTPDL